MVSTDPCHFVSLQNKEDSMFFLFTAGDGRRRTTRKQALGLPNLGTGSSPYRYFWGGWNL